MQILGDENSFLLQLDDKNKVVYFAMPPLNVSGHLAGPGHEGDRDGRFIGISHSWKASRANPFVALHPNMSMNAPTL